MNNEGRRKIVRWIGIALGIVVILALGAVALLAVSMQQFQANDEIAANVRIAGIDVGGLTPSEAQARLESRLRSSLSAEVKLIHPNGTYTISREKLGVVTLLDEAVREAMRVGRAGSLLERMGTRLQLWRSGRDISIPVWFDQHRLRQTLEEIAAEIDCEPVDAQVRVTDDDQVEKVPGQIGVTLQIDKSQAAVKQALADPFQQTVTLVVLNQPPNISTEDLQDIEVVLGSYSTPFNPGQVSRSHNLRLAMSRINNTLLLPGEEFSLNETVGPRSVETGYRMAPIFSNNEVVPGIGGGVCQVSTTTYNAALLANMEMIERRPHSRPVPYCPAGRDATVVYGQTDMRFKNSLKHPVLILGGVKGNRLWVKILGKAEDDYDVKLIRTGISRSAYATKEVPDPELEEGQREIETEGRNGLRVTLIREVYTKDGKLVKRQTLHTDVYRAQTEIVRVGTKPTEAELAPADESSSPGSALSPVQP